MDPSGYIDNWVLSLRKQHDVNFDDLDVHKMFYIIHHIFIKVQSFFLVGCPWNCRCSRTVVYHVCTDTLMFDRLQKSRKSVELWKRSQMVFLFQRNRMKIEVSEVAFVSCWHHHLFVFHIFNISSTFDRASTYLIRPVWCVLTRGALKAGRIYGLL